LDIVAAIQNNEMEKVAQLFKEVVSANPSQTDIINTLVDHRDEKMKNLTSQIARKGMTLLNYAAYFGHMDIIEFFLLNRAGMCMVLVMGQLVACAA
jgi:ankyrin repeat protein